MPAHFPEVILVARRIGTSSEKELTYREFVVVYTILVFSGIAVAIACDRWLGIAGERVIVGYFGAVFLLAGLRLNRKLFLVVRSTGWFALVPGDDLMAVLIGGVGLAGLLGAIALPW